MTERGIETATIIDDMHDERRRPGIERVSQRLAQVGILHIHKDVVGGESIMLDLDSVNYVGEEEIMHAIDSYRMAEGRK